MESLHYVLNASTLSYDQYISSTSLVNLGTILSYHGGEAMQEDGTADHELPL